MRRKEAPEHVQRALKNPDLQSLTYYPRSRVGKRYVKFTFRNGGGQYLDVPEHADVCVLDCTASTVWFVTKEDADLVVRYEDIISLAKPDLTPGIGGGDV